MDLAIRLLARSGKFQELCQTLLALLDTMRNTPGCWECHIYQDMENSEKLVLSVQWEGVAALEQYMRSESGGAILGALDLLGETVETRIVKENPWVGIEALKRMRSNL
ncbi:MAG: putative quinol monooxygenase [Desulfobulbus sp.]